MKNYTCFWLSYSFCFRMIGGVCDGLFDCLRFGRSAIMRQPVEDLINQQQIGGAVERWQSATFLEAPSENQTVAHVCCCTGQNLPRGQRRAVFLTTVTNVR
eukprot:scpid31567/ scgid32156/ 